MMSHSFFKEKKILLIDADDKKKNDRTWCFWEDKPGIFQPIVYKEWESIDFYSSSFSGRWEIAPYRYKMIRGIDLYRFVFAQISSHPNIHFLQDKVQHLRTENGRAFVQASTVEFNAQYLFNSIVFQPELLQQKGSLLQHFKGWMISTEEEQFDSRFATFMDFRMGKPEQNAFVYVLPLTNKKALVEYTVLSSSLLSNEEYNERLTTYTSQFLRIYDFKIEEKEFGVIPMSNFAFAKQSASPVIHVGTAGGQTKGSSGYTFQFIQKQTDAIIQLLLNNKHPVKQDNLLNKRFKLYDDTLLHVLCSQQLTASKIFSDLFSRNKPQIIFKFLDNETTVIEELKIMNSVPSQIFLKAAGKQLLGY